jgi:hypothetical protein
MKTKEKWIDETMEAFDGITRAEGDPFIHEKVMQRIHQNPPEIMRIQPALIWKIAAGIAVLVSINLFTLFHRNPSSVKDQTAVKTMASEYFSYIDSNDL